MAQTGVLDHHWTKRRVHGGLDGLGLDGGADPRDHAAEQRALQISADTPDREGRRESGEIRQAAGMRTSAPPTIQAAFMR
jgi:hypothetical protein